MAQRNIFMGAATRNLPFCSLIQSKSIHGVAIESERLFDGGFIANDLIGLRLLSLLRSLGKSGASLKS